MEELDLKTLPSSYDREPHFPFTDENDGAEIKQEQLSPSHFRNDNETDKDFLAELETSLCQSQQPPLPSEISKDKPVVEDTQKPSKKDLKLLNDYVWDVCSERLDIQIPFTLQPSDKIQQIVDSCLETFPNCSADTARKRIRAFFKNSRRKRKLSSQEEEAEEETANGESKVSKKKKQEDDSRLPPSPWAVLSLSEFLHYKCPICVYASKEEAQFIDHAYEHHKESVVYLCTLTTVDYTDHDGYNDSFTWSGNDAVAKDEDFDHDHGGPDDDTTGTDDGGGHTDVDCKVEVKVAAEDVNVTQKTEPPKENDPSTTSELHDKNSQMSSKALPKATKRNSKRKVPKETATHECQKCDLTFTTQGKLNQHRLKVHHEGVKSFQCSQCPSAFIEKYRLTRHIETVHTSTHNFVCDKCPKTFKAANKLKRHVLSFHEQVRRHLCDQCDKSFFALYELKAHKAYKHDNVKNFQCDKCPNTYSTVTGLKRHCASVHGEGIQCPKCDRRVPNQWDLYRHIAQSHEGVRKHKCLKCTKAFILPKDLERHVLSIHDGIKNEVCDICHKAFALKGNLVAHKKKVHKETAAAATT